MQLENDFSSKSFKDKFKLDTLLSLNNIKSKYQPGDLDEQAIPAYLNPNPLAQWLFWQRIWVCVKHLPNTENGKVLDFGCGSGILLPILNEKFKHVVGVDVVTEPALQHLKQMKEIGWKYDNINIYNDIKTTCISDDYFDFILALDVLEHVENLEELLKILHSKLKKDGILLISGPTENLLYKIGRLITGYSGHYHIRNIYDIRKSMQQLFNVTVVKKLVFPFNLFLILKATKK